MAGPAVSAAELIGQLLLGWLLADLLTGAFHWWEDRFGREDWPLLGRWLIAPNRLHHLEPLAFAQGGFLDRNGASIIAAAAVAVVWILAWGLSPFLVAAVVGGALANEVHYLAHRPSISGPVLRVLQQTGLLQSPKAHALHHRPPHDVHYCVLTDWLNPALEALDVWNRAERLLGRRKA